MKTYVLGFLFHRTTGCVALIEKKRPDWQAGKLNGIDGKVEPGESLHAAMVREFWEEAGVLVESWEKRGVVDHSGNMVHVFRACEDVSIKSMTDELVSWHRPFNLTPRHMPNLWWMLPLVSSPSRETFLVVDNTQPWKAAA